MGQKIGQGCWYVIIKYFARGSDSNDRREARTKDRPLARGDVTPTQALGFLGLQLSAGLAVLTQFNWYRYVFSVI